jgi:hypothetical protein
MKIENDDQFFKNASVPSWVCFGNFFLNRKVRNMNKEKTENVKNQQFCKADPDPHRSEFDWDPFNRIQTAW